jgi:hypothetical protein
MAIELLMKGWLEKKKSNASVFGSDTNRRWFVLDKISPQVEMDGFQNKIEFTLSYYKSPLSSHRCGWFFLADVQVIQSDDVSRWISIDLPNRKYQLRAPDHRQHDAWVHSLRTLCSNVDHSRGVECDVPSKPFLYLPERSYPSLIKKSEEVKDRNEDAIQNQLEFLREINHDKKSVKDWPTIKDQIRLKMVEKSNYHDFHLSSEETIHSRVGRAILESIDSVDQTKNQESESSLKVVESNDAIGVYATEEHNLQSDERTLQNDHRDQICESIHRGSPTYSSNVAQLPASEEILNERVKDNGLHHQKALFIGREFDGDSECSFLPDEDFVNEKWDSSSSEEEDEYK